MATKPTDLVRWADVGGSIVEPASGKKDVGFVAGERPPAQYLNWLFNRQHAWIKYVSDGIFTGAAQFVDGIANGLSIVSGNLLIAAGGVTALGDIETDGWFVHGEREDMIPVSWGNLVAGGTFDNDMVSGDGTQLDYELGVPMRVGDQLNSISVRLKDVAGQDEMTVALMKRVDDGGAVSVNSETSAGDGTHQVITVDGEGVLADTHTAYFIRVTTPTTYTGSMKVYSAWRNFAAPGEP